MNILHLQPELNVACGISNVIFNITKEIQGSNHYIITLGGDAVENFTKAGINVKNLKRTKGNPFNFVTIIIYVIKFCRKNKIDIINSHHRYFDLIGYLVLRLFLDVRTVTTVHNKVFGKKLFSYKSEYFIAVSYGIKKHLMNYYKIPEAKITVISNFIVPKSMALRCNNDLKRDLNIDPKYMVITYVGRIAESKGIRHLLQAFATLYKYKRNIVLILAGNGELFNETKMYSESNQLPVIFIGSYLNINDVYKISDIVVLPSLTEGFPLVMLESGFMQKPFIGTRIEGIKEFITENEDGVLVEPDDTKAIIQAIDLLLTNDDLRLRIGRNLYKKVMSGYTSKVVLSKIESFYKTCININ